jgi:hypothetical protein
MSNISFRRRVRGGDHRQLCSEINVGVLGIAFAFIIGVFFGGMKVAEVAASPQPLS